MKFIKQGSDTFLRVSAMLKVHFRKQDITQNLMVKDSTIATKTGEEWVADITMTDGSKEMLKGTEAETLYSVVK